MKTMRVAIIFALIWIAPPSFAAPGVSGSATSGFRNPDDTTGLCTPDNKEQEFYQVGYCKAIYEKLVKPGCTKDLIEEMRLRTLGDKKQMDAAHIKNQEPFNAFQCDSKAENGKKQQHIQDLAKDPVKYAEFIMQFFSTMAISESDWDPKLKHTPKKGDSDGAEGLLNLSRAQTDDKQYQCDGSKPVSGCKTDDTTDGKSPGPQDPNYSLTCGVHMALTWIDKDNRDWGRKTKAEKDKAAKDAKAAGKKVSPDDEWTGAGHIFSSLRNTKVGEESPQAKMIYKKLEKYCEKYAFTGAMSAIEPDLTQDLGATSGDATSAK